MAGRVVFGGELNWEGRGGQAEWEAVFYTRQKKLKGKHGFFFVSHKRSAAARLRDLYDAALIPLRGAENLDGRAKVRQWDKRCGVVKIQLHSSHPSVAGARLGVGWSKSVPTLVRDALRSRHVGALSSAVDDLTAAGQEFQVCLAAPPFLFRPS